MFLDLLLAAHLQDKALFSKVELAYTCRYYKPGNAKSRNHLYLINGDGSNRRLLPTVGEPLNVKWVGSDRLEWDERRTDGSRTMTSKLSPWRPVRTRDSIISDDTLSLWPGFEWVTDQLVLPNGQVLPLNKKGQAEDVYDFAVNGVTDWLLYNRSYALRHPATRRTFFLATSWRSSTGAYSALFEWNEKDPSGTVKTLFTKASSFEFHPSKDVYAWVTHRDTLPLDPKGKDERQVWVGAVGVGSQKLGKRVFPVSGVAWATSVAIRPSR